MLLSQSSSKKSSVAPTVSRKSMVLLAFVAFSFLIAVGLWYTFAAKQQAHIQTITCSAEHKKANNFEEKGYVLGNAHTQSAEKARTGAYACKLNASQAYGMSYMLENPKPNSKYKVSIWRYSPEQSDGMLAVSGKHNIKLYKQQATASTTDKADWEQLELVFSVPYYFGKGAISIYPYTSKHPVFFDDLHIEYLGEEASTLTSSVLDTSLFRLELGDKSLQKIKRKRQDALGVGILISADDDWVKGDINMDGERLPIELRLKGDYLDHLKADKWSFRIKVKDPKAWNRLKTFSIQNPATREFLKEWVFHQFLHAEDVLSPRYDFMQVHLNNKSLGIYAYEEHFDKQLPEYLHRREGPIVRFTEDAFWLNAKRRKDVLGNIHGTTTFIDGFEVADIEAFKSGKTAKSPVLRKQFEQAHTLMQQYKYGTQSPEQIFDLPLMAKYYAIVDICKAYHGLVWHNFRFYFNPLTTRLEPIGFDGFGANMANWRGKPFIGHYEARTKANDNMLFESLFKHPEFVRLYVQYLYTFTDKVYLEQFMAAIEMGLNERKKLLQQEFEAYTYNTSDLLKHATKLRATITPFEEHSLMARKANTNEQVQLANMHNLPLQVIGFGSATQLSDSLSQVLWLATQQPKTVPVYTTIAMPKNVTHVYFALPGIDKLYKSSIKIWSAAASQTPLQRLLSATKSLELPDAFIVTDSVIQCKFGKYTINENICIPKGYSVHIQAGTTLNFIKKAKFISYSPLYMYGTAENPIQVTSSDQSANGFTIIQASRPSKLRYVQFDNLNTLSYEGWQLTGAVTFYESEVYIDHCTFTQNHCEDALNLVRCVFDLQNSMVSKTYGDGFDGDFCEGRVKDCRFVATGNDALDFSGSVINIDNCQIVAAGDKGVSVGEESTVHIKNLTIHDSPLAVASKDLSKLSIDTIAMVNCVQGFVAFQKKPEYGGSSIKVKAYAAENVDYLHKIEPGSRLQLKGQLIKE